MAHSNSARNPKDNDTVCGRWLSNGAYAYYGAIREPHAQSFNRSEIVAQSILRSQPLGKAFTQKTHLIPRFTLPWRLVYIGDPLLSVRFAPGPDEPIWQADYRRAMALIDKKDLEAAKEMLEKLMRQSSNDEERDILWSSLDRIYEIELIASQTGKMSFLSNLGDEFFDFWFAGKSFHQYAPPWFLSTQISLKTVNRTKPPSILSTCVPHSRGVSS